MFKFFRWIKRISIRFIKILRTLWRLFFRKLFRGRIQKPFSGRIWDETPLETLQKYHKSDTHYEKVPNIARNFSMKQALVALKDENQPEGEKLSSITNKPSPGWDDGVGYNGARELANTGWNASLIRDFLIHTDQETSQLEYVMVGAQVDMGRFVSGEPEHILQYSPVEKRPITIWVNIGAAGFVGAKEILNRGMALAAIINSLEATGYSTEIKAVSSTYIRGKSEETKGKENDQEMLERLKEESKKDKLIFISISIKKFGELLDYGRMAFWMGHPAALRRLEFRYLEQIPEIKDLIGPKRYGSAVELPKHLLPSNVCYLPTILDQPGFDTPKEALESLSECMAFYNVHFDTA